MKDKGNAQSVLQLSAEGFNNQHSTTWENC